MPYVIDAITAQTINVNSTLTINGQPIIPGKELEGTNYVYVAANGTPTENAAELQAAYDLAKTMSPSSANTITVIAAPGEYRFATTFVMDTEYVNLVSLTGNADVIFDLDVDPVVLDEFGDIVNIIYALLIDTNNVYVKGIQGKDIQSVNWNDWWGLPDYKQSISVSDNLPKITVENCISGYWSFGSDYTFGTLPTITVSGTFINCKAAPFSFGYYANVPGTFLNCIGILIGEDYGYEGNYLSAFDLFGSYGDNVSGYFENCKSGNSSFGSQSSSTPTITSGTFINCICRGQSFGYYAIGKYINCKVYGSRAFGVFTNNGGPSGYFENCSAYDNSFGSYLAQGMFINCTAQENSFGGNTFNNNGNANGTFINCIGGNNSFGVRSCQGTFTNCTGGQFSFGGESFGVLTAKLYYCRLTFGTFKTVSGGGITRYCIDGNNAANNQG